MSLHVPAPPVVASKMVAPPRCLAGFALGLALLPGVAAHAATPPAADKARIVAQYGRLPLSFEVNAGQSAAPVKFLARGQGYSLFLTGTEAVLSLRREAGRGLRDEKSSARGAKSSPIPHPSSLAVLRLKLLGANPHPAVTGQDKLPGISNYFIGNDKTKWHTHIANYGRVRYSNVYRGIDMVYYGNQGQLEYDLIAQPGADVRQIRLGLGGARRVWLNPSGELVLETGSGRLVQHAPIIYQTLNGQRRRVAGGYELRAGHSLGFQVGAYDHTHPLVLDPSLTYSTYLGGGGDDLGNGIAVDSNFNAYVTGYTNSSGAAPAGFPTTAGAFQPSNNGGYDAFVSKLKPDGSGLLYSTYLGGGGDDFGNGIAVDSNFNAYVTGYTTSSGAAPAGFPTTAGAFQPSHAADGGDYDAFVSKLKPDGSGLLYSTYLGGTNTDVGFGIAVDSNFNAYVTGYTTSSGAAPAGFPTTAGAFQPSHAADGGANDAFVSKLKPDGSGLLYSTYLGGTNTDVGLGIAVDSNFNAYVTGYTYSSGAAPAGFPTTAGAFQPSHAADGGGGDAFVSKLNPSLTGTASLVYSTYLGGSNFDQGNGIAVDSNFNAYVTGQTNSSGAAPAGFPTTAGAFQPSHAADGGAYDAFVSKLKPDGSGLLYSTYLGGGGDDFGNGIAVDSNFNAYVTGQTNSSGAAPAGFPTTAGAFQPSNNGGYDAFVSKLKPDGSGLLYSTYLGGGGDDLGLGIAVDSNFNAYVTGQTNSSGAAPAGFPTTAGAFQPSHAADGGAYDAFVSKLTPPTATYVTLVSFDATRYSTVLWLTWRTGLEVDNLGFNVYREVKGKKVRLNGNDLIAGSAIQTGANSGCTYAWPDALIPGAKYWLEDLDLNGTHTWHGPITPRPGIGSAGAFRRSPVLGQGN